MGAYERQKQAAKRAEKQRAILLATRPVRAISVMHVLPAVLATFVIVAAFLVGAKGVLGVAVFAVLGGATAGPLGCMLGGGAGLGLAAWLA